MSQVILSQILDQLKALEPAELQQLSQAIQDYLSDSEMATKQAAFHRALLEAGLVRYIKAPIAEERHRQNLVVVEGTPVSQTIIAERR